MSRKQRLTTGLLALAALLATPADAAEVDISWQAPTQNVDGTALTDLTSYMVYIGQASRTYTITRSLNDPTLTTAVVTFTADWIQPGDNSVYVAMTAWNSQGEESAYSNEVVKTVTVTVPPTPNRVPMPPVLITLTLTLGGDCPQGSVCDVTVEQATTLVVTDNTSAVNAVGTTVPGVSDSRIKQKLATTTYGNQTSLEVTNWAVGDFTYSLIAADLSAIPGGAIIDSATLHLFPIGEPKAYNMAVHRLLQPWDELTVTWTNRTASAPWDSPGASALTDRSSEISTALVPVPAPWYSFNVTEYVRAVVAGSQNNGVLIRRNSTTEDRFDQYFVSSDGADGSRPEFVINYRI